MGEPIFLGLGSNQAQPAHQLALACAWLRQHSEIQLWQQSGVYQSPAMRLPGEQSSASPDYLNPDYLNMVVEIRSCLTAQRLLDAIKQQEQQQGRDMLAPRWSSRPLDMDILLYGQQQIETERLRIPHLGVAERDFVLLPWRDISPNTVIPGLGTVADCASALGVVSAIKLADRLSELTSDKN